MAEARDEGRHPPGQHPLWSESWYFDFAAADGRLGGFVRLGLYPNLGTAWYWAYLVGEGRPLVAVRDHEVAVPRSESLEIRAEGLWSAITCETAYEHWSIGLEAFGVGMDDPLDAFRGERGDRVPLGFDLEWETAASPFSCTGGSHYEQSCSVHGDVLVGRERLEFDGRGQRHHSWGVRDWWTLPWCKAAGSLGDRASFVAMCSDASGPGTGYLAAPGGAIDRVSSVTFTTNFGTDGLPASASMGIGLLAVEVTPLAHAPLVLDSPDGSRSRLLRSLCRFDAGDGRAGVGWTEWLRPPGPAQG